MSETKSEPPVWSPFDLRREHLLNNLITVVALLFWARVLLYGLTQEVPRAKYGAAFLAGGVLIYTLDELRNLDGSDRLERLGLWICALVGVAVPAYVWLHYEVLETQRIGYALGYEYAIGGLFGLVVLYLTYRAFGAAFAGVVIASVLYAYFGNLITGLLGHGGRFRTDHQRPVDGVRRLLRLDHAGRRRQGRAVPALRGADARLRCVRSDHASLVPDGEVPPVGVAQSAVISSLIVGSINGAQTANAAMTGSFTIPLMKESGMKSDSAGGIEAVASAGGQIMPPVMGAAAFVMASLIPGLGYVDVLIAGIIPAVVFYISVAIGVHYMAVKQLPEGGINIEGRLEDLDDGYHPLIETIRFGVPFAVLLYTLGIAQWTVISSALYTCGAMVLTGTGIPFCSASPTATRTRSKRSATPRTTRSPDSSSEPSPSRRSQSSSRQSTGSSTC